MLFRRQEINYHQFSFKFFTEAVRYGLPLVAVELGHNLLNLGDRYLIQYYLGSRSVGLYSAAYNLTNYLSDIFKYPVLYAIFPIYMEVWTNEGKEKTQLFLSRTLTYFLLAIIPVTFGFVAISKELMIFLASEKYGQSYVLIPYILIGLTIYSTHGVLSAGLHISKKTPIIAALVGACLLLNIVLNILLIPRHGIVGAAIATLIAYTIYIVALTICSFRLLSFRIDVPQILKYSLFSAVMFVIVRQVTFQNQHINLLCKIGIGVLSYSSMLLILDKDIRAFFVSAMKATLCKLRLASQNLN
jgi:O-antigen/teichoic acid export membrane protein